MCTVYSVLIFIIDFVYSIFFGLLYYAMYDYMCYQYIVLSIKLCVLVYE